MNIDEKLEYFYNVSIETAMAKKDTIVHDYMVGLDVQFENFKKDTTAKYKLLEKTTIDTLRQDFSKDFSLEQQHIRRKLTHKKDELKEKLFEEVSELLKEFLVSEAYTELLIKEIKFSLSVAPKEPITIYIDPIDADKKEYLEEQTGTDITISGYSFGQGMRAIIPSKNILIDYSFNRKLNDIKENYSI